MFYKLLNAYTRRFKFPHRGLKYFIKAVKWLRIENKTYEKKLGKNFYMELNPMEHIQQQLLWYGHYEKELGDFIKKAIRPADVFFDIGANIGYFSLLAAKVEPSSVIISFEPVKIVFKKLEKNILLSKASNITTVNAAVGDKAEVKDIYLSTAENVGMSSLLEPENYSGITEKVKVVVIDEWFKSSGLQKLDMVKLDIEGNELAALKGMNEILKKFCPMVISEINPIALSKFGVEPKEIFEYLHEIGFNSFLILKNGDLKAIENYQSAETKNAVFIHTKRMKNYSYLF